MSNKICLHQWIKPNKETKVKLEGVGNCQICTPHEDNKHCKRYCEITKPENFKIGKEKENAVY